MPSQGKTLSFLYNLQRFGIKAGIGNIRLLMDALGHPERKFTSVHIAGTNGKGSTAAMIASVLTASGYRTGLYTSPHLCRFSERIRIDGSEITRSEISDFVRMVRPVIQKTRATFFEATTAMAFHHFAENRVDIAVIETGLGGRWDATNIITPQASVITNIGLEHVEYLGATYHSIAKEKGGIIKPGVPCVSGVRQPTARRTLRRIAEKCGAKWIDADQETSCQILQQSLGGIHIRLGTRHHDYQDLFVSLAGDHQAQNARLAIVTLEELEKQGRFHVTTNGTVRDGLESIRQYSGLRGRLEPVWENPTILIDVAHNADGARALASALKKIVPRKLITVFGIMKDKNYEAVLDSLAQISRMIIAVEADTDRSLPSEEIVDILHCRGSRALNGGSVKRGMDLAIMEAGNRDCILVTGSHYVVGEAIRAGGFSDSSLDFET